MRRNDSRCSGQPAPPSQPAVIAVADLGAVDGGGFMDSEDKTEINDSSQTNTQQNSENRYTLDSNNQTDIQFHFDDAFNTYRMPSRNKNSPVIIGSTANNSITINYK